jgi:hypothetical protein
MVLWFFESTRHMVDQAEWISAALHVSPASLCIRSRITLSDGSIAKYLRGVKPVRDALLREIPGDELIYLTAGEWLAEDLAATTLDLARRLVQRSPVVKQTPSKQATIMKLFEQVSETSHGGVTIGRKAEPSGHSVLRHQMRAKNPKALQSLFEKLIEEDRGFLLMTSMMGTPVTVTRIEPSEQRPDVTLYKVDLEATSAKNCELLRTLYGEELTVVLAPQKDDVVFLVGSRENVLKDLERAGAAGAATLDQSDRVKQFMAQVSPNPYGVMIADLTRAMNSMWDLAEKTGDSPKMPIRLEGDDLPLTGAAVYLREGHIETEIVVPMAVAKSVSKAFRQLMGGDHDSDY